MKKCIECGGPVTGRSDKKYCSDECRTAYNNGRYRKELSVVLSVNRILRKNYIILDSLYLRGIKKSDLITIAKLGFDHRFCTSFTKSVTGNKKELFCYDYSIYINNKSEVRIKKHIFASRG